jgi:hypothetical protein
MSNTTCTVDGCLCQKTWTYSDHVGEYHAAPKYRVEVRSDEDGAVDEVLLHDATRCLFHLERMSKDSWWFGIYPEGDPLDDWDSDEHFDIIRDRKRVEVEQR